MKPWSRLAQSWGMNRLKRNSKTESWKTKAFAADTEVSKQKEQKGCSGDQEQINDE